MSLKGWSAGAEGVNSPPVLVFAAFAAIEDFSAIRTPQFRTDLASRPFWFFSILQETKSVYVALVQICRTIESESSDVHTT